MADTNFTHDDLELTKRSIRLITFLPRLSDGTVCLRLYHIAFEDAQNYYDALSYTWGPETPTQKILINGRSHCIRQNLASFLNYCSDENLIPGPLWTDSICINQENTAEKNHQVAMMGDIFRGAARVLVWLGNASLDSRLGELLSPTNLLGPLDKPLDTSIDVRKKLFPDYRELMFSEHEPEKRALPSETHDAIVHSLFGMNQNPYWRRLWIVQELLLAKQALVICRHDLVSIDHFFELVDVYLQRRRKPTLQDTWTDTSQAMRRIKECMEKGINQVTDLIGIFARQQCWDRRDRIYGLMSCSPGQPFVKVDYGAVPEALVIPGISAFVARWEMVSGGASRESLFSFACILIDALEVTSRSFEIYLRQLPVEVCNTDQIFPIDCSLHGLWRPLSNDDQPQYIVQDYAEDCRYMFREYKPMFVIGLCKHEWYYTDWLCFSIGNVTCLVYWDDNRQLRVKGFLFMSHKAPILNKLKRLRDPLTRRFEDQISVACRQDDEGGWYKTGRLILHLATSDIIITSELVEEKEGAGVFFLEKASRMYQKPRVTE